MSDRMTCDIVVLILHILISNITSSQDYLSKKTGIDNLERISFKLLSYYKITE